MFRVPFHFSTLGGEVEEAGKGGVKSRRRWCVRKKVEKKKRLGLVLRKE